VERKGKEKGEYCLQQRGYAESREYIKAQKADFRRVFIEQTQQSQRRAFRRRDETSASVYPLVPECGHVVARCSEMNSKEAN